jgi:ABC-2 type transport system ATP-binding protein
MDSHSSLAVEASGLVKAFGTTRAVDGVDLAVPTGSVYGFRGRRQVHHHPHAGHPAAPGRRHRADPRSRPRAPGRRGPGTGQRGRQLALVDEDLTGRENPVLLARLLGHTGPRPGHASELPGAFGLAHAVGRLVKTYSGA